MSDSVEKMARSVEKMTRAERTKAVTELIERCRHYKMTPEEKEEQIVAIALAEARHSIDEATTKEEMQALNRIAKESETKRPGGVRVLQG